MPVTVDLIVNPASGTTSRTSPRSARLEYATRVLRALGANEVRGTATRQAGDGAAAARRAIADSVEMVVVWGGDGTLNEVASALAGTDVVLGIVPGGSGNGLARGLRLPLGIDAALALIMRGSVIEIDMGIVNGRPFFNLAGMGLDAAVAHRFNLVGGTRGLRGYVRSCAAEIRGYTPCGFTVHLDGAPWFERDAHLVVVANGPQYGHGARIAPGALFQDGLFDVVVVTDVTLTRIIRYGWRVFAGSIGRVPGVHLARARHVVVRPHTTTRLHLDGEMLEIEGRQQFEIRERALKVRVPKGAGGPAAGEEQERAAGRR